MPHKKTKESARKKVTVPQKSASRKLKQSDYRSFRLEKRIKHSGPVLPSARKILVSSIKHILEHKKLYLGIALVYMIVTIVLVRGFVFTSDLSIAKESIEELLKGATGKAAASLTVFGILLGSNNPASQVAGLYQAIIIVITSLAFIWALRQTHAGETITVKDAFYKSTYPLIPFVIVLLFIGLQLLPIVAANFLYSATVGSGVAVSAIEVLLWVLLSFLLVLWSLYMVTSSAFALYISTLPDMTPRRAIKSAKALVQYRRWTVMRKVIFIPVVLLLITALIEIPIILFITPLAETVFLILTGIGVVVFHSYMYLLYRELL